MSPRDPDEPPDPPQGTFDANHTRERKRNSSGALISYWEFIVVPIFTPLVAEEDGTLSTSLLFASCTPKEGEDEYEGRLCGDSVVG